MLELPFEPPIQKINWPAFEACGVEVSIKREDLIHPFVSGNKWRKLKYVFAHAAEQQKRDLVTFGGAYSNHLLALACAGAMYGFRTRAFVRGEEVQNHMLFLCSMWGMELTFVSREVYRDKNALFEEYERNNPNAYFIDEGGRGDLAAKGCEEIVTGSSGFSHVICAVGTGTTLAGLAREAQRKSMIAEGICALKGAEQMDREIEDLAGFPVKVHHQFSRGGYAKSDPELIRFIQAFASHTGILLDHVYTAKMIMAVEELVKQEYYSRSSELLLIHTGGLLGLLSQANS